MKRYSFLLLALCVSLYCFGEGKNIVGTYGDKAVKAYRKKIPQQAEGYYIKVTPTETVVAGRDESGLFYGMQALQEIQNAQWTIDNSKYKEVLPLKGAGGLRFATGRVWLVEAL